MNSLLEFFSLTFFVGALLLWILERITRPGKPKRKIRILERTDVLNVLNQTPMTLGSIKYTLDAHNLPLSAVCEDDINYHLSTLIREGYAEKLPNGQYKATQKAEIVCGKCGVGFYGYGLETDGDRCLKCR